MVSVSSTRSLCNANGLRLCRILCVVVRIMIEVRSTSLNSRLKFQRSARTTGTSIGWAELAEVDIVPTDAGGAGHEACTLVIDSSCSYIGMEVCAHMHTNSL